MDMVYPYSFDWFVQYIKAFSMDIVSMIDMGCMTRFTYYHKFMFGVALPLTMLAGSYAIYHILRIKNGEDPMALAYARNVAVQMALFVTFLIYPFVSQTIFSGFNCRRLGDHEAWLSADYQISCNTVGHVLYIAAATMAVGLYPIGVPLGTLFLLMRNRKEMMVENSPARLRYAFLVSDYKPAYFYWEILEMARKVTLNSTRDGTIVATVFHNHNLPFLCVGDPDWLDDFPRSWKRVANHNRDCRDVILPNRNSAQHAIQ
jgi:hypothetical protein